MRSSSDILLLRLLLLFLLPLRKRTMMMMMMMASFFLRFRSRSRRVPFPFPFYDEMESTKLFGPSLAAFGGFVKIFFFSAFSFVSKKNLQSLPFGRRLHSHFRRTRAPSSLRKKNFSLLYYSHTNSLARSVEHTKEEHVKEEATREEKRERVSKPLLFPLNKTHTHTHTQQRKRRKRFKIF